MTREEKYMEEAIALSEQAIARNEGGPFGCVVVKGDEIIGRGNNKVIATNDPTAHAEVIAIRDACQHLQSFQLEGCEIFTSCEPCPMCLGAIYWARPSAVYFANSRDDAAAIGFDDRLIYEELGRKVEDRNIPFYQLSASKAAAAFRHWQEKGDKTKY